MTVSYNIFVYVAEHILELIYGPLTERLWSRQYKLFFESLYTLNYGNLTNLDKRKYFNPNYLFTIY